MPANTAPIYTVTPHVGIGAAMTAANTATDGTGTVTTLFTAGSNGSFVDEITLKALGTNSSATVFRLFVNNGGSNGTATNNSLIREMSLPSTTSSNSAADGSDYTIPLRKAIPASYVLIAVLGTAVSPGWIATVWGGDY